MLAPTPSRTISIREHVPNLLSFARGLAPLYLPPLFIGTFSVLAAPVAALVCFTDWLDGYLARKWKCQSWVGAVADIVSDKIACYTIAGIGIIFWGLVWWWFIPFAPIIAYDAYTLSMRASKGVIAPSNVAKVKTTVLMVSLVVSVTPLSWPFVPAYVQIIGVVGVWLTAVLIFWSALRYWWPHMVPDMPLPGWTKQIIG